MLAPVLCRGILPLHAWGGCCPRHIAAPAVPCKDSDSPWGLISTKTGTSPAHPTGTPDTRVIGQQGAPRDCAASWPALALGWVASSCGPEVETPGQTGGTSAP